MSDYVSTATTSDVASRLREAQDVVLTTHAKPDGDALGSVLAIGRALRSLDRRSAIYLHGPTPPNLMALIGADDVVHVDAAPPEREPDLIVVTDTGARSQLEPFSEWIEARRERAIILDHHVNGDDLATMRIVDPESASATELITRVIDEMGVEVTGGPFGIAEALLLGLATDTGWFKFDNADAAAFRVAARLLEAGADKSRLYAIVEENDRPERLAMTARAIASTRYVADGRAAVMSLERSDFQDAGGVVEDLTGIVNEPLRVGSVQVSVLLSEPEPGVTKASFRSKPAITNGGVVRKSVDVNAIARRFDGGGHVHAAGARLPKPLDEAREDIILALEAAFD